ncbi:MAG: PAS domain S-box protein [bacterium]
MELILDLAHNVSLLLALTVAFDAISRWSRASRWPRRLVSATLFAAVALVGMMTPLRAASGVIYDGRSIVLFVAGYLGGGFVGGIAALVAAAYRIWLGGAGTVAGLLVIVEATAIGVVAFHLRRGSMRWETTARIWLLAFGVHVLMLVAQLAIPWSVVSEILPAIIAPVLLLYPAATVVILRIVIDREDQRRTSRRLAESERRYRSLFENTYAPMLILEPDDGSIVDANEVAAAFYGWSVDELRTMSATQINTMHPDEVLREMAAARRGDRNYFELNHRLRDGTVRDVAVYSGTVTMDGRERLYSIIRDITDEHEMQRELRILSHAVEHAAVAIFRVDETNGLIRYANRRACDDLGYTREALLGMSVFDVDAQTDQARWGDHLTRLHRTGSDVLESVHRRSDGSLFPVIVTVTSFQYAGERHSVSFVTDISQRRAVEVELERSLAEKESLLREVHHRVKNNLAIMSGLVNLELHDASLSPEEARSLQKVGDRIIVMGLLHNILYHVEDVSRLDAAALIRQIASHLASRYAGNRTVRPIMALTSVTLDVDHALPLALIANEAITNAYEHAFPDRDGGAITVELAGSAQAHVWLRIADNGVGMDPEHDGHAAGALGMNLMRMLARQIDATLEIRSANGTEVVLVFPVTAEGTAAETSNA